MYLPMLPPYTLKYVRDQPRHLTWRSHLPNTLPVFKTAVTLFGSNDFSFCLESLELSRIVILFSLVITMKAASATVSIGANQGEPTYPLDWQKLNPITSFVEEMSPYLSSTQQTQVGRRHKHSTGRELCHEPADGIKFSDGFIGSELELFAVESSSCCQSLLLTIIIINISLCQCS